jgi:hypothetical protein
MFCDPILRVFLGHSTLRLSRWPPRSGLETAEVIAGRRRWAVGQLQEAGMSAAGDEVHSPLVDREAR